MEYFRKVYKYARSKYNNESKIGLILRPDSPTNPSVGLLDLNRRRIGMVGFSVEPRL